MAHSFCPLWYVVIEEAPLNYNIKQIPSGYLDMLVVTPSNSGRSWTQVGILIIDGMEEIIAGFIKMEFSLNRPESGMSARVPVCLCALIVFACYKENVTRRIAMCISLISCLANRGSVKIVNDAVACYLCYAVECSNKQSGLSSQSFLASQMNIPY